uniref:NAD-dependent epimerase/dehydratase domain-containing protein n=2 Tax=Opuntia streptacantha TaxID=393608 RepID=A0A7C9E6R5_OPUST
MYWLKQMASELRPDHMTNQIHYEDAASLAVAILKKNLRGRVFLGCDNHPLSRQEIMELVNKSGKFSGKFEGFTGATGPLGKRLNNSRTCEEIGWEPKYPSFAQFVDELRL